MLKYFFNPDWMSRDDYKQAICFLTSKYTLQDSSLSSLTFLVSSWRSFSVRVVCFNDLYLDHKRRDLSHVQKTDYPLYPLHLALTCNNFLIPYSIWIILNIYALYEMVAEI